MDKKNFIQNFVIQNIDGDLSKTIDNALQAYDAINGLFTTKPETEKKEGFETAKGKYINDYKLTWFEAIWKVWNLKITPGSRGGKRDAGDAFLKQITVKAEAETAYRAARQHATKERPALEAKGQTPPYFNRWLNDGRWDTRVVETTEFEGDEPAKISSEVAGLREQIAECESIIKQFSAYQETSSNPNQEKAVVTQAKDRLQDLKSKLMQSSRCDTV